MKTLLILSITALLVAHAGAQWNSFGRGPKIVAPNGQYLGRLNSNPFDPESVANPYGRYGNPYGDTITNPFSRWGSPYSPVGFAIRSPQAARSF